MKLQVELSGEEADVLNLALRQALSGAARSGSKAVLPLAKQAAVKHAEVLHVLIRKLNGEKNV